MSRIWSVNQMGHNITLLDKESLGIGNRRDDPFLVHRHFAYGKKERILKVFPCCPYTRIMAMIWEPKFELQGYRSISFFRITLSVSEESLLLESEILRYTQNDKRKSWITKTCGVT